MIPIGDDPKMPFRFNNTTWNSEGQRRVTVPTIVIFCYVILALIWNLYFSGWKSMNHLRLTFITHHTQNFIDTPPEKNEFWLNL